MNAIAIKVCCRLPAAVTMTDTEQTDIGTPGVSSGSAPLDFRTEPARYRHWKLATSGPIARLEMDVDESGAKFSGYELKLNSYDIGVDMELYDAVQRLRFERPEIKTVVVSSGKPGMFCAGANIRMLARASHGHKVNFCKFTNETRNAIEEAGEFSGQRYLVRAERQRGRRWL